MGAMMMLTNELTLLSHENWVVFICISWMISCWLTLIWSAQK
jgi:hypothetical protein